MIDTQTMKGVHVDPATRACGAQAGLSWKRVQPGLPRLTAWRTTGGVRVDNRIAGLTLGGGLGWLMGKYGMAVDNVRSVELVDASGQIRTADAEQNPDLLLGAARRGRELRRGQRRSSTTPIPCR